MMSAIKTGGDGLRLTLDVPESDVLAAAALITLRNCALKITVEYDSNPHATKVVKVEKPKREKKPAKEKGIWGKYWEVLCGTNFIFNHPDLQSALPMDMGGFDESHWTGYKDCLKAVFEVDSLTFISPEQFEKWCEDNQLFSIITISRQAVRP